MLSQKIDRRPRWLPLLLITAGFWFSSSLVLDLLVMPVMEVSGMTTQASFASAGYTLFWAFNRVELLCGALLVTGALALRRPLGEFDVAASGSRSRWTLMIGLGLLALALIETYLLAPEMSALALSLNGFEGRGAMPPAMDWMHGLYWALDGLKLLGLGCLVRLCSQDL